MYAAILRRRVHDIYDRINDGDYLAVVDALAPTFESRCHGEHSLGGRRTDADAMTRWWQRLLRIFPDVHFHLVDVIVDGTPWHARIATRARITATLPGGEPYENTMFQIITTRWGRITCLEAMEDIHVLDDALATVAQYGNLEALAAPIDDDAVALTLR